MTIIYMIWLYHQWMMMLHRWSNVVVHDRWCLYNVRWSSVISERDGVLFDVFAHTQPRHRRAVVGFWKVVRPCRAGGILYGGCLGIFTYNLYCVGGDVKHCSLTHSLTRKKLDSPFLEAILEHLESLWAYKKCQFYRQVPETFAGRTQEIYKSEN